MKYSLKGRKDRKRQKDRIKKSGQARLVYVQDINRNIPATWRSARADKFVKDWDKVKLYDPKKEK